jgi:2-polyprenyl-6-methoxyphenol hydroxylase-like FAD-dependent oxidoreductase
MVKRIESEALVVGAGPVGMLAALALAQRGIGVEIVDEEWRSTARSYALALHSRSLELLDALDRSGGGPGGGDLVGALVARGHRIERVAFYDRDEPRATVDVSALGGKFPFVLVIPQKDLEDLLEERLEGHGVRVQWNHRLADLAVGNGGPPKATVERLAKESTGYSVATTVWVVEKTLEIIADFVIGADGHRSRVRRALRAEFPSRGDADLYAVFELDAGTASGASPELGSAEEVRVVMADGGTDVLWPLGGGRYRWSFQVEASTVDVERPDKSRLAVQVGRHSYPFLSREDLETLITARAPWFGEPAGELAWSVAVQFERRLVSSLGRNGVWLAGDAAHLGPPIGVHSMNAGLAEVLELASKIAEGGEEEALVAYDREVRAGWGRLLDLSEGEGVEATADADPWVRERAGRILACLPASGGDLARLAEQLGLKV